MASKKHPRKKVTLFYSYSHQDEKLRDALATHLALLRRQGIISEWYDRNIDAGEEWREAIDENLNSADIILLLISPPLHCLRLLLGQGDERITNK